MSVTDIGLSWSKLVVLVSLGIGPMFADFHLAGIFCVAKEVL